MLVLFGKRIHYNFFLVVYVPKYIALPSPKTVGFSSLGANGKRGALPPKRAEMCGCERHLAAVPVVPATAGGSSADLARFC